MLYCVSHSLGLRQWERERRAPSAEEELLQERCEGNRCAEPVCVWETHSSPRCLFDAIMVVIRCGVSRTFHFTASRTFSYFRPPGGILWFLPLLDDLLFSCSALSWQPERHALFTIILFRLVGKKLAIQQLESLFWSLLNLPLLSLEASKQNSQFNKPPQRF